MVRGGRVRKQEGRSEDGGSEGVRVGAGVYAQFNESTGFELGQIGLDLFVNYKLNTMSEITRELTFGEKAVGLTFNPGGHPSVNEIKQAAAAYIDVLYRLREATTNGEVKRQLSIGITEAQTSQMWAVKGVTWQY